MHWQRWAAESPKFDSPSEYPERTAARKQKYWELLMFSTAKQMIEAADAEVPRITVGRAQELIEEDETLIVDVRESDEIQKTGIIAGAIHVSRGMLEFRADPQSPYHDKRFARRKTILLYCSSGGRSALSGKTLKDMGYDEVYNLGGFKEWAENGGATERLVGPDI